jgi:hypothetical protein
MVVGPSTYPINSRLFRLCPAFDSGRIAFIVVVEPFVKSLSDKLQGVLTSSASDSFFPDRT